MTLYELLTIGAYIIGGILGYIIKDKSDELKRQGILLNKTREEVARDYITKIEVRSDMAQIINRFDRLEEKIDRLITEKVSLASDILQVNGENLLTEMKKIGIEKCLEIITNDFRFNEHINYFNSHKKRDDLSDAFLQGLWFISDRKL